jgi:isocitrate dehydrogenase (NAD+)
MSRVITLIPGDGIGPEVTEAVVRIFKAAALDIDWERYDAGMVAFKRFRQSLPVELLDSIKRNQVALKGPVTTPIAEGITSVNVGLRKALDLYANLRPVRNLPGVESRFSNVDLVIVRENTEDLYSGLEHEVVPGVVESLKIITERASTRIARFAFDHVKANGRTRVTAIHKANIMKLGDGLFLRCSQQIAKDYPEIQYDEMIIDNTCMQLVMHPEQFDVLLMENLYGDIVSDLCAGLVGGLGMVPGANIGDECAVFEAVHGSAPDIAGKNLANPTALMRAGVQLLAHLNEFDASVQLDKAIARVYAGGKVRTRDAGGSASTTDFTEAVLREIEK